MAPPGVWHTLAFALLAPAEAFTLHVGRTAPSPAYPLSMVATEPASSSVAVAERYVATNRFRVKQGREAAFEKRWADRKSRLGLLDGFRFFCMMRRCEREGYEDDINYVSCTVWETADAFNAWKSGDAFKEAHGGGTVGGIASMLIATAMNTKGKPKAAMWEGTLPVSIVPEAAPSAGWREVVADGESTLPGECYIAMNRFSVKQGHEGEFEQRFATRESTLKEFDGFKGFLLLRRDGKDPDGFTHSTFSVWKDEASFNKWKNAEKPKPPASTGDAGGPSNRNNIFERPPVPVFYEGILTLESAKGI
ncbi:hypothetical protein AB1Y20_012339 [Prymnesium parvum]|uniref:ABM domain-containing protein n=1 Tax=Prymnesium parvum TaxID=97485 RepID=A0AB34IRT0_PRYPA